MARWRLQRASTQLGRIMKRASTLVAPLAGLPLGPDVSSRGPVDDEYGEGLEVLPDVLFDGEDER